MAKFCGKCGTKLDETTGLCPKCEAEKSNMKDDNTKHVSLKTRSRLNARLRKRKRLFVVFSFLILIFAGVGGLIYVLQDFGVAAPSEQISQESQEDTGDLLLATEDVLELTVTNGEDVIATPSEQISLESQEDFGDLLLVTGDVLGLTVTNADDVIAALSDSGEAIGYKNALHNLSEVYTTEVGDFVFYRLLQNYESTPVYGKTVTLVTSSDGIALVLSGNSEDISADGIINGISITVETAQEAIIEYFGMETVECYFGEASQDDIYLYKRDESWLYVYDIFVEVAGEASGSYECLVDAETAEIIDIFNTYSNIEITYDDYDITFDIMENNGEYLLSDQKRNIYIGDYKGQNSESKKASASDVTSADPTKFDADGLELLYNVSLAYDYFYDLYDDDAYGLLGAFYNDGCDNGENARGGGSTNGGYGFISMGSVTGVSDKDVLAHEYTHVITGHLGLPLGTSDKETGAIIEGVADIFGTIIEAYMLERENDTDVNIAALEPDWVIEAPQISLYRDLKSPSTSNNFSSLNSLNWFDRIFGDKYEYSTLISHAAYLMWSGINGDEASKLNSEELSLLWYFSIMMFPSDVDFEECRALVEICAAFLTASGYLSTAQLECVSAAFDEVGINAGIDAQEYADKFQSALDEYSLIAHKDLVIDAYYEVYEDEYGTYEWRVPEIVLEGENISLINSELWNTLYDDAVEVNHEGIQRGATFVTYDVIAYEWAVNQDVLSLWARINHNTSSYTSYFVYNIYIPDGTALSTEQLLQHYGISQEEYEERAQQALYSFHYDIYDESVYASNRTEFIADADDALEKTISTDNILKAMPFLNENGELCIACATYSIAGAEYYYTIINLENYDLPDHYPDGYSSSLDVDTSEPSSSVLDSYKAVLQQYSDGEYTLYDIDEDALPELIIKGASFGSYDVYTISSEEVVFCGEIYSTLSDCLYEYSGNGVIVYEGGSAIQSIWLYSLSEEVVGISAMIISTENSTYEDLCNTLDTYTLIDSFCPVNDYSLLIT